MDFSGMNIHKSQLSTILFTIAAISASICHKNLFPQCLDPSQSDSTYL
jgi:hypothetical protein